MSSGLLIVSNYWSLERIKIFRVVRLFLSEWSSLLESIVVRCEVMFGFINWFFMLGYIGV